MAVRRKYCGCGNSFDGEGVLVTPHSYKRTLPDTVPSDLNGALEQNEWDAIKEKLEPQYIAIKMPWYLMVMSSMGGALVSVSFFVPSDIVFFVMVGFALIFLITSLIIMIPRFNKAKAAILPLIDELNEQYRDRHITFNRDVRDDQCLNVLQIIRPSDDASSSLLA